MFFKFKNDLRRLFKNLRIYESLNARIYLFRNLLVYKLYESKDLKDAYIYRAVFL